MRRFLVVTLFAIAAMAAAGVQPDPSVQLPGIDATTQLGGGCGCPKTAPVCCQKCDGSFAYCARSHAYCPECAAP